MCVKKLLLNWHLEHLIGESNAKKKMWVQIKFWSSFIFSISIHDEMLACRSNTYDDLKKCKFPTLGIMMRMGRLSPSLVLLNIIVNTAIPVGFTLMRRMSHLRPGMLVRLIVVLM